MIDCCIRPQTSCAEQTEGLIQAGAAGPAARQKAACTAGMQFLQPVEIGAPDAAAQMAQGFAEGAAGAEIVGGEYVSPLADAVLALAEVCTARGAILSLPCLPPVLFPDAPPLQDYLDLAARFPALRLLLGNFGGGLAYYENMRSVRAATAQVFYGTWTAVPADLDRALHGLPTEKLVYGSAGSEIPALSPALTVRLDANARRLLQGGAL